MDDCFFNIKIIKLRYVLFMLDISIVYIMVFSNTFQKFGKFAKYRLNKTYYETLTSVFLLGFF